jgi:hypothetical protein
MPSPGVCALPRLGSCDQTSVRTQGILASILPRSCSHCTRPSKLLFASAMITGFP